MIACGCIVVFGDTSGTRDHQVHRPVRCGWRPMLSVTLLAEGARLLPMDRLAALRLKYARAQEH
jgi:hypothetical protein